MNLRPATAEDAPTIGEVYAYHVLHGFGTFEETPPDAAEMARRMGAVLDRGLPYVVAEAEGRVLGFAYAGPFNARAAYRFTVEDSVYVAHDLQGRGVGRAMLARLLRDCEALGVRQVVAVIGDSGNAGSIGLHRALGFQPCGIGRGFGYKAGRWLDVVWMQKSLNGGQEGLPLA